MRQPGVIDWTFKKAIADAGFSQQKIGELVGINHTLVSMYVHGRYVFSREERQKIALTLKKPETEIFCDSL